MEAGGALEGYLRRCVAAVRAGAELVVARDGGLSKRTQWVSLGAGGTELLFADRQGGRPRAALPLGDVRALTPGKAGVGFQLAGDGWEVGLAGGTPRVTAEWAAAIELLLQLAGGASGQHDGAGGGAGAREDRGGSAASQAAELLSSGTLDEPVARAVLALLQENIDLRTACDAKDVEIGRLLEQREAATHGPGTGEAADTSPHSKTSMTSHESDLNLRARDAVRRAMNEDQWKRLVDVKDATVGLLVDWIARNRR